MFTMLSVKNVPKQSVFFVKIKYVACRIEYMLPMTACVKGYDIENEINTSQSINCSFQATENMWDSAHF